MTEQTLQDAILRHSLQILRLSAGEAGKVDGLFVVLIRELKMLVESGDLSAASQREVESLIKQGEEAIRIGYLQMGASTDTHALAVVVAEHTQRVLEDVIPANVRIPTDATLMSLTDDVLIDGAPSSAWWNKQAEDLKFKFAAQVRQGIANNETQAQIVTRIVGKRGEPGIMDRPRRDAMALVHSSVMTAANRARLETFRKNARLLKGVRWLSTLDSHVCFTGETLVTMADGNERRISEIRAGDVVTGGVTGEPCAVIFTAKSLAQSTVVIHKNGVAVGASTDDHPILTPAGWREIGSVALSADVSEREVLCRGGQASECEVPGTSAECRSWPALRPQPGMAEARRPRDDDHRQGKQLRDGVCDGDRADRAPEHQGAERLQHDERRGLDDRCDPRRGMASQDHGEQPAARLGPGGTRSAAGADDCELGALGVPGEGQRCTGSQAGRATERPGVEGSASSEVRRDNAAQVAGSRVPSKDGNKEGGHTLTRSPSPCCSLPFGGHDAGETLGGCAEVLGHPEGVTIETVVGIRSDEPVEVYTLTIAGDPTFIAGGMIVHNCIQCAALDGQLWNLDGEKLPGTTVQFMAPPAHFSCRCVLSPVAKTFKDIGLDIPEPENAGQRASSDGPLHGKTTFDDFLKRQSPEFIASTLGKQRAALFQAGKLTVRDLVGGTGRELTLEQLRNH